MVFGAIKWRVWLNICINLTGELLLYFYMIEVANICLKQPLKTPHSHAFISALLKAPTSLEMIFTELPSVQSKVYYLKL